MSDVISKLFLVGFGLHSGFSNCFFSESLVELRLLKSCLLTQDCLYGLITLTAWIIYSVLSYPTNHRGKKCVLWVWAFGMLIYLNYVQG